MEISIQTKADGRAKVTVAHSKLATCDDAERSRQFWAEWLEALEDG